jgi:hypothetical protein
MKRFPNNAHFFRPPAGGKFSLRLAHNPDVSGVNNPGIDSVDQHKKYDFLLNQNQIKRLSKMKKCIQFFFALFLGLAMISCSGDNVSPVDMPDIGNGNGEENGMIYSIHFDVEGTADTFTFSVDMTDAVIENDDLPDDFEGDTFVFDPDSHQVFVSGSMIDWQQPGTDETFRLTTGGTDGGSVEEGDADFRFFIVFDGMDFDDNEGWDYGEWEGTPDRNAEIIAGGSFHAEWGDRPVEDDDENGETPESVFMIGSALNMDDSNGDGTADGWDWELTDAPMVPVHSNSHLFWKIAWLYEDGEFKFAPQKDFSDDFGYDGEDPVDEIYQMGDDNITVPGGSGYYMVVVNFETNEVSITEPQVYVIGETIGSWDEHSEEGLFEVDNENEVITITRDLEEDELRMYAWFDKGWFSEWWQSEFMIFDEEIEFRGDGDEQERVHIDPAGEYTIDLNFRTGEGSVESQ